MGEIADGLINGDFDFYTGEYMGRGGGFPRWHGSSRHSFCGKTREETGVKKWLLRQGYNLKVHDDLIRLYASEKLEQRKITAICNEIQKDWQSFVTWVNQQKSKSLTP